MENTKNCVLIGQTGNGKSSLGNFMLGYPGFEVSDESESCTKQTIPKISKLDPKIGVVDTPGLEDDKGRDKIHYDDMLKVFENIRHLHFILIVLNYANPRFSSSIQYMIKFLCNVFPKNFAYHVGIVFTHYEHEHQMKINKNKNDPREKRKNFILRIMELISQTTNEELFKGPPVFFLDSYVEDDNSKEELNRIIAFAKTLKPIENIRANCNIKNKTEEYVYETRNEDRIEGNSIVTYIKKYKRKKYTDYNNNITYGDWELISTDTKYSSVPVVTHKIIQREPDNTKEEKEEKKINIHEEDDDNLLKEFLGLGALTIASLFIK